MQTSQSRAHQLRKAYLALEHECRLPAAAVLRSAEPSPFEWDIVQKGLAHGSFGRRGRVEDRYSACRWISSAGEVGKPSRITLSGVE